MRSRPLAIVGLAAAAVFFSAVVIDTPLLQWLAKPIPVLALALWAGMQPGRDAKWIAAGLGFSALGDLLLSLPFDAFVFGLLAFLLAHLLYLTAFVLRTRAPALGWAVPVTAFGVIVFVTLQPHLGELRYAVLAYVIEGTVVADGVTLHHGDVLRSEGSVRVEGDARMVVFVLVPVTGACR